MKIAASEIIVQRDVSCAMRDGTILRGDVYRPGTDKRYPVLVHRTPYGKTHPVYMTSLMIHPFEAVEHGYALFIQDVRGRFQSDGNWSPIQCESQDGYDTVEWASAQPWSNGQVGIYGSSYMCVSAAQATASKPPHLKAAALYIGGSNSYDGFVYSGGAFEALFMLRWFATQALDTLKKTSLTGEPLAQARERLLWIIDNPAAAIQTRPLIDVFGAADSLVPHWRTWLQHPDYDAYWKAIDPVQPIAESGIPLLNIAGWYDGFLKGHLDLNRAIQATRHAGGTTTHQNMIIGPWDHESYISLRPSSAGDSAFGSKAVGGQPGLSKQILEWFDQWLQKEKQQTPIKSDVRYFVMGTNAWQTADQWPPQSVTRSYYLAGTHPNTSKGNGRLAQTASDTETTNRFVHDPNNPVPTIGGRHLGYWYGHAGVQDQAPAETRHDVLVFTSDALTSPLSLIGNVQAELFVRCSAQSADFNVKLIDVRPNGYCANIVEGILRVKGLDQETKKITVDLWDTAYVVPAGNRLRVEIAGSNFPRFDVNDGCANAWNATAKASLLPVEQQILTGGAVASRMIVQVVD